MRDFPEVVVHQGPDERRQVADARAALLAGGPASGPEVRDYRRSWRAFWPSSLPTGGSGCTPGPSGLVGRQRWPGNLRQLREALREALRRRPVGEILLEDLPDWCRTAGTRALTPVDAAERDLIVTVLRRCGGNRLRAAASLGMARSSLYRKVRTYAITDL